MMAYQATYRKCHQSQPQAQPQDFHATFMTGVELVKGFYRAERKAKDPNVFPDRQEMYQRQANAYRQRLEERYHITL